MANSRGKAVILTIFAVGVFLAIFSIWYLRQLRSQAVEFWGKEVTLSIRDAPQVDLLEVIPGEGADASLPRLAGGKAAVATVTELNGKPGLYQMRILLMDNGFFQFDNPPSQEAVWTRGLRFSGSDHRQTTLLFDLERGQLWHEETGRQVEVAQREFLTHFLADAKDAGKMPH